MQKRQEVKEEKKKDQANQVPKLSKAYTDVFKASVDKRAYAIKIPGLIRLAFVAILVIAIISLNFIFASFLSQSYFYLFTALKFISLVFVLFVIHKDRNTSYVLAWTIIILAAPVAGFIFYLLWGRQSRFKKDRLLYSKIQDDLAPCIDPREADFADLAKEYPDSKLQASFLVNSGFPVYRNTKCTYYSLGEQKFVDMFIDLKQAKKFIFVEYFILADGIIWQHIEDILIEKASQGVDVRLLFDDFGSIIKAPNDLIRKLRSHNIKVYNFNPVARYIAKLYINYRNHQKCCIIDGNIAYTGGTNIADEYANLYPRFGHWKDTAIKLEGDAVWGLTTMFLTLWQAESGVFETDVTPYMPDFNRVNLPLADQSFFIPYWDSPLNNPKNPAEDIYRSIINTARERLYICTPYFIVDDSMIRDICRAAESGVDVRLITPGKPDKWYAYVVTQSNYDKLLESGVKVFEYTPGFIHAKTILADDNHAVTGCVNFDYRSFHLHFENSVYICGTGVVKDILDDFTQTFSLSNQVDLEKWRQRSIFRKMLEAFMRIFSPLL